MDPPGYAEIGADSVQRPLTQSPLDLTRLKYKKAWEFALSGAKSIPMNAFMLYMSGNSIQIFSIFITASLIVNSLRAVISSTSAFDGFRTQEHRSNSLLCSQLVFVLIHMCNLALGVYKVSEMGLLPTHSSDWLQFIQAPIYQEIASGSLEF